MEEQIKVFIAYLHETKKTSGNTELSYQRDLYKLAAFLRERSVTEGKDITAVSLHEYVLFLEKADLRRRRSREISHRCGHFAIIWRVRGS